MTQNPIRADFFLGCDTCDSPRRLCELWAWDKNWEKFDLPLLSWDRSTLGKFWGTDWELWSCKVAVACGNGSCTVFPSSRKYMSFSEGSSWREKERKQLIFMFFKRPFILTASRISDADHIIFGLSPAGDLLCCCCMSSFPPYHHFHYALSKNKTFKGLLLKRTKVSSYTLWQRNIPHLLSIHCALLLFLFALLCYS